ncbi:MAG: M20/M25/M40 family metallo-hydrolase [Bacteroidales bacterium]|nr:M20/M25/M40 family metallo-hydrolase [Bacteroidales bacterium]MBR4392181.1 M20/M25/M40 family metallo-hydrolase [Bacteroidales bacterium]
MKKILTISILALFWVSAHSQAPHLFDHSFPVVQEEQPQIRTLMDQVSVDSIQVTIEHLQSYHTRRWNSKMVYQVQDWLYNSYGKLGFDSVYFHDFPVLYQDNLYETSDNVIAFKRGLLYPDEYVVCGAHYDSYNKFDGDPELLRAPGADDNASGVAGVLEIARLLSHCTFERSVIFIDFAAEEIGLYGSAAYAHDCAEQLMDIVAYFNLDMIGYLEEGSDIHAHLLYTGQDAPLASYVFDFSHVYYPDMRIRQGWLSNGDSDYSSFNRNGYPAIHIFEDTNHSSPFIHTPDDILGISVNNMNQAKRFTEMNLGLVAILAGLISNEVDDVTSDGLVVFPNPVSETLKIKGIPMNEVSIYNLMGQRVLNETCRGSAIQLDVASLAAGVYVLRVLDDAMKVHTHRMVKY